jgi:flavin-dependent dehydrogenase
MITVSSSAAGARSNVIRNISMLSDAAQKASPRLSSAPRYAALCDGQRWDVIIVGAGVAGGAAAITLADAGARVLVLEKSAFPRHKPCGCCLHSTGVAALSRLGIEHCITSHRWVDRISCMTSSGEVTLAMPPARVMSRCELDSALMERAAALGATFVDGCDACVEREGAGDVTVTAHLSEDRNTPCVLHASYVIDATGLLGLRNRDPSTPVAPRRTRSIDVSYVGVWSMVPADAATLGPELTMMFGRYGYVGAVRLADGTLNIAAAVSPRAIAAAGSSGVCIAELANECKQGWLAELAVDARWRGTPPLTGRNLFTHLLNISQVGSRAGASGASRVVTAGDSTGFIEPVTGEGMSWGLLAGEAIGLELAATLGLRRCVGRSLLLREMILQRQRRCALTSGMLRSNTLRHLGMSALRTFPKTGEAVIRAWMSDATSRRGSFS